MAITITTSPGNRIAVFGNPILIASTTSVTDEVLRLRVLDGDTVLAEQYALVISDIGTVDGFATFQIGGVIQSILKGFNNPVSYTMATGDVQVVPTAKHYKTGLTITVTEPVGAASASLTLRKLFKSMDIKSATWVTGLGSTARIRFAMHGLAPKRFGFQGMKVPLTFFSEYTATSPLVSVNDTFPLNPISVTPNQEYFVTTWADSYAARVKVFNVDIGKESYNELTLITRDWPCRGKILYFLNDLGGWEWHPFVDYDITENTEKEQLTTRSVTGVRSISQRIWETRQEYKLYSDAYNSDHLDYLRFLLSSPVVLDENGAQVRVIDSNLKTNSSDMIEPRVTIQYIEQDVINV